MSIHKDQLAALHLAQDWAALRQAATTYAKANPKQPEGYYYLGLYYRQIKNPKAIARAGELFDKALQLAPDEVSYGLAVAQSLADRQQLAGAELLYRSLANSHPQHADVYLGLGQLLIQQENYEGALEPLQTAHQLAPDRPEPLYYTAYAQDRLGETAAAYSTLDGALQLHPHAETLQLKITLLYEEKAALQEAHSGDQTEQINALREEMMTWYTAYETHLGEDFQMLLEHAQLLLEVDDAAAALPLLRKAQQQASSQPPAQVQVAEGLLLVVLLALDKPAEALEQSTNLFLHLPSAEAVQAIVHPLYDSSPNAASAAVMGALLLQEAPQKAVSYLTEAIEKRSEVADLYAYRALAYEQTGEFVAAWQEAERAQTHGFSEVGMSLQLQLLQKEPIKALLQHQSKDIASVTGLLYETLAVRCPDKAIHQLNYAQHLSSQLQWAEAHPYWVRALDLSDTPMAAHHLGLAQASLALGKAPLAEEQATLALALSEEAPAESLYLRAQALRAQGQYPEALSDVEACLPLEQNTIPQLVLRQLRNLLWIDADQKEKAIADYKKLVAEGGEAEAATHFGMGYLAHKEGRMDHSYKLLRSAEHLGAIEATVFLKVHFKDYLLDKTQALLEERAAAHEQHAQSPLQYLFGSIWICERVEGLRSMEDIPEDLRQMAIDIAKTRCMIWTAQFILDLTLGATDLRTYRLVKQQGTRFILEITSVDGMVTDQLQVVLSDLEAPTSFRVSSVDAKGYFEMRRIHSEEDIEQYEDLKIQSTQRSVLDLEALELV